MTIFKTIFSKYFTRIGIDDDPVDFRGRRKRIQDPPEQGFSRNHAKILGGHARAVRFHWQQCRQALAVSDHKTLIQVAALLFSARIALRDFSSPRGAFGGRG